MSRVSKIIVSRWVRKQELNQLGISKKSWLLVKAPIIGNASKLQNISREETTVYFE